jgi:RNA 2',3'-cyclic 3'-phosphodiesterase
MLCSSMFGVIQQGRVVLAPAAEVGLFFSVFPDASAAAHIAQIAEDLRFRYGLDGSPLLTTRFHSSLYGFDDRDGVLEEIISKAKEAAASVVARPFRVSFNCAKCFSVEQDRYALVLTGDDGVIGLMRLYSSLCMEMRRVGLRPRGYRSFTPHVTMLYCSSHIDEQPIEPVYWTVDEFVFVKSLTGRTVYQPLGRWRLRM